ncbi:multidrug ABC transporter ATP-binding protein [Enterococcus florum]|uniref:Multidrug ABC transporter ATP-binding protein n=1 Tax=Enterococcus florum TaxID=2480627 RepID=A0A4P5P8U5_9ENTE|nr:ABC transporter ATP-binding protein [Enterococcus florum]GCF94457.1 multidrug ABC transporter ATP-binding protein [Enterococcus florum]
MKLVKGFFINYKKMFFGTFILMLLQAIGTLMIPYFVAEIIDDGIITQNLEAIWRNGGYMLLIAILTGIVAIASSYYSAILAGRFGFFLREQLVKKTQSLSLTEMEEFGTPTLLARTTSDITNIQQILMMVFQMIIPAPLICLASIILTGMISWRFIWIPILSILLFSLVSLFVIKKSIPLAEKMQQRMDLMMKVLREFYTGVRVIRAFDKASFEKTRTDETFVDYSHVMIHVNKLFAVLNPTVNLVMGISMTFVLAYGGSLVLQGAVPIGSLTAISEYTILSLWFLTMAAMVIVMIPKGLASLERINEVIETEETISDGEQVQFQSAKGEPIAVFDHVEFSYNGAEESVLSDITFEIPRGVTAIVGGTGSGKSTIAKALMRFEDASKGEIRFLGKSIKEVTQDALRRRISYVPQKAFLFSGTIEDNFLFGNPEATKEEMEKIASIAQAAEFINGLEKKYQAPVAQKGNNFSGGQKQRLSIARALIKPADLYFFDDSFSALDYQTDAKLRQALKNYLTDAAIVIVAQRLSTIKDADQIIVLEEGKIIGKGNHDELMASCNVYQEFAKSQGMEEKKHEHEAS